MMHSKQFQKMIRKARPGFLREYCKDLRLRRSPIALLMEFVPMLTAAAVLYYVGKAVVDTPYFSQIYIIHMIPFVLFTAVRIFAVGEYIRRYWDDLYVFSPNSITHQHGRLSLNYRVSNVKYSDIREVQVRQSVLGRMFDYGDVLVGTAATSDFEITIKSIGEPQGLLKIIEDLKKESSSTDD